MIANMEPEHFKFISTLVNRRSAIVLEENKEYLVEARMSDVCRSEGLDGIQELVERLKSGSAADLETAVVEAMTTNETSFFRDIKPFEVLKTLVIPELLERNGPSGTIHIWCAASSSGQEPYTIAMALKEAFPELIAAGRVTILATDLSREMVERSAEGIYSQIEVNRGLPAPLLVKYFEKVGTTWRIREELRKMIEFRQLNLIEKWPSMPEADIVFIRNVLIYFDVSVKKQILEKVRGVLRPEGYLLLGGAETTLNIDSNFDRPPNVQSFVYQHRKS